MADIIYNETSGLPMIYDGEEFRVLAALPSDKVCTLPLFNDVFETVTTDEWIECSLKHWNTPIWDQGRYGSCSGQASGMAFTYSWLLSGQPFYEFSPTSVYARINGGRDNGATVADTLTCLKKYGIALMSQFGQNKIYTSQLSQEAIITAKRFRILAAYRLQSVDELFTALIRGLAAVSGIAVGQNFSNLDSNGVAPLPNRIAGGHALTHIGLKKIKNTWVVETQNSWGKRWGKNGFCYLQRDAWDRSYGFPFDCYAIGAVIDDPSDDSTDPEVLKRTRRYYG